MSITEGDARHLPPTPPGSPAWLGQRAGRALMETLPPWARAGVAAFNHVHHSVFASLQVALPQVVAVFISCFVMALLIVAPCFLPLLLWASSSETARPTDSRPAAARQHSPLSADDGADEERDRQPQPVAEWSVEHVCAWLKEVELAQLSDNFAKHDISGDLLFQLSESDIRQELHVEKLADRKRLTAEIAALRRRDRWWVRQWVPWGRWLGRLARRPAPR